MESGLLPPMHGDTQPVTSPFMRLRVVIASFLLLVALPLAGPANAGLLSAGPLLGRTLGGATSPQAAPAAPVTTLGGRPCRLIGVPLAAPIGLGGCGGVRPGALVEVPDGQCSLNFLFRGDGQRFMGTAGHCVLDGPGERTWAAGGPQAKVDGAVIGEFAYAVLDDLRDFSLIRLYPGVAASAQMCHFGGPTGVAGDSTTPVVLHHYGNGIVVNLVPARTGIATSMTDPNVVAAVLLATPGDSGSAVIDSAGGAVGVLVALELATAGAGLLPGVGPVLITRIEPQRSRAQGALGLTSLTLQTAPLL